MGIVDTYFNNLVEKIIQHGKWQRQEDVRAIWEDGSPAIAKSVIDVQWKFDNDELLYPTTKKFYPMSAIREIRWIWQKKSNRLEELRKLNKSDTSIWDKWEYKNGDWAGTIGPAYGYVLSRKIRRWKLKDVNQDHLDPNSDQVIVREDGEDFIYLDQVDHLIQSLLRSPGSRRNLTTLWVPEYLDEMKLTPCVWSTQWNFWGGKLNLTVNIRSNDICVGNPFNVFQYQVLQMMISKIVNIPMGTITFNIADAHIYDRHIDLAKQQIIEPIQEAPKLILNPDIKNFYEFDDKDFIIIDKPQNVKRYDYEVAI